ncbi:MAG: hypothetical protein KC731_38745, partial [Myxococcales bacterium]|nr:hypothetical protein [Myxococcales bacterium]
LCALLNIEGNRALDDGDTERAEVLMRLLIDAAADAEFLSNDEVSSFPRRVAKAGLFDELSAAFADLVANRDWRNLDEGLS